MVYGYCRSWIKTDGFVYPKVSDNEVYQYARSSAEKDLRQYTRKATEKENSTGQIFHSICGVPVLLLYLVCYLLNDYLADLILTKS